LCVERVSFSIQIRRFESKKTAAFHHKIFQKSIGSRQESARERERDGANEKQRCWNLSFYRDTTVVWKLVSATESKSKSQFWLFTEFTLFSFSPQNCTFLSQKFDYLWIEIFVINLISFSQNCTFISCNFKLYFFSLHFEFIISEFCYCFFRSQEIKDKKGNCAFYLTIPCILFS